MSIRPVLDSLTATLRRNNPPLVAQLADGLDPDTIARTLSSLPVQVAAEVHDYFAWHNGLRPDRTTEHELFPEAVMLSLEEAIAEYHMLRSVAAQVSSQAGVPASTIWDERWLPLFRHPAGGAYHVTVAGTHAADRAAILSVLQQDPASASVAFDSLTALARSLTTPQTSTADTSTVAALVQALADPDGSARGRAATALIKLRDPAATPLLIEMLAHDDEGVRQMTARILAQSGDVGAVPALIAVLENLNDPAACEAASALGHLKARDAAEALTRALDHGRQPMVRSSSAWALGEIKAAGAVDALVEALHDRAGPVRSAAAKALGDIGDERAVAALEAALADDFLDVRQLAEWAIKQVRKKP